MLIKTWNNLMLVDLADPTNVRGHVIESFYNSSGYRNSLEVRITDQSLFMITSYYTKDKSEMLLRKEIPLY